MWPLHSVTPLATNSSPWEELLLLRLWRTMASFWEIPQFYTQYPTLEEAAKPWTPSTTKLKNIAELRWNLSFRKRPSNVDQTFFQLIALYIRCISFFAPCVTATNWRKDILKTSARSRQSSRRIRRIGAGKCCTFTCVAKVKNALPASIRWIWSDYMSTLYRLIRNANETNDLSSCDQYILSE